MNKAKHIDEFIQLTQLCEQITPYLKGEMGPVSDTMLRGCPDDSAVVAPLYRALAHQHPEAGKSYWLARTWDLLCWQPLYISMVAIYGLGLMPSFTGFAQSPA